MTSLRRSLTLTSLLVALVPGCPSASMRTDDAGRAADAAATDTGTPAEDTGTPAEDTGTPSDAATADAGTGLDAGPSRGWDVCMRTSQCTLAPNDCCGPCGTPTLASFDGVNTAESAAHTMDVCPVPTPCPACATSPNPNLIVTCAAQRCTPLDVSMLPLSECTADSDCVLRYANCCACSGTPEEIIAVRTDAESAIAGLLCDPGGCPTDCIPTAPTGHALCDVTTHHCVAVPLTR